MGDREAYRRRALQLAERIYGHSTWQADGPPVIYSANDNGFPDPCDALARLGVAKPYARRSDYRPWRPGDKFYEIHVFAYSLSYDEASDPPVRIIRHRGEPSYTDLLRVLCQQAWFHSQKLRDLRIDLQSGEDERSFIEDLISRELGVWTPEAGFNFSPHGWEAVSNDYWAARSALATELGGEESLFPASMD